MARTIMVIGAHPDDIEIGAGVTILQTVRAGHRVVVVDMTDGEETPHGNREIRAKETARANAILGIEERVCLKLPNRVLMDTVEARRKLAVEMRRTRPELILTHMELDVHPDHVATFQIARGAVLLSRIHKTDLPHEPWRPGRMFHFVCSHLRQVYDPSFVVPAGEEEFTAKMDAIMAYESQFVWHKPSNFVKDLITVHMRNFGALIRQPYGEAFVSQEPIGVKTVFEVI